MGIYVGAACKAGIGKEESGFGTGGTRTTYIDLIEESVNATPETIEVPTLIGSRSLKTYEHGTIDTGGSFKMVVNPDNFGLLTYMAMGVEAEPDAVDSGVYKHSFTPAGFDTDLDSFVFEINRKGGAETASLYRGCVVNTLDLEATKGSLLTSTLGIVAKDEQENQTATTPLAPSTKQAYGFKSGSVEIDETPVLYVNSATFSYSNDVDTDGGFVLANTPYRSNAYKTTNKLTGTLECQWTSESDSLRTAFINNADKKLELIFQSNELITTGYYYTMTITIPVIKFLGDLPTVSSREKLNLSMKFEAVDAGESAFITIDLQDGQNTKYSA